MAIGVAVSVSARPTRVHLDAPGKAVPDGDGGYTQGYDPLVPPVVSAKIEAASTTAIEHLAAGTILSTATHLITVPYQSDITTQTRVQWTDDALRPHTANVTAVINVDERCVTLILGAAEVVA